jgi:hypothetical protein
MDKLGKKLVERLYTDLAFQTFANATPSVSEDFKELHMREIIGSLSPRSFRVGIPQQQI